MPKDDRKRPKLKCFCYKNKNLKAFFFSQYYDTSFKIASLIWAKNCVSHNKREDLNLGKKVRKENRNLTT